VVGFERGYRIAPRFKFFESAYFEKFQYVPVIFEFFGVGVYGFVSVDIDFFYAPGFFAVGIGGICPVQVIEVKMVLVAVGEQNVFYLCQLKAVSDDVKIRVGRQINQQIAVDRRLGARAYIPPSGGRRPFAVVAGAEKRGPAFGRSGPEVSKFHKKHILRLIFAFHNNHNNTIL